jgi:hypothetical protein
VFLLSGGKILYRIRGPVRSAASAGTLAALNHSIHGPGTFTPSSPASFIHSRFCAAAVRKRALELPAACSQRDDSQVEGFHTASANEREDRARVLTLRFPTCSVHGRFCVLLEKERAQVACQRNYCQGKNCDVIRADVRRMLLNIGKVKIGQQKFRTGAEQEVLLSRGEKKGTGVVS